MISQKDMPNIALGTMQFLWTTTEQYAYEILDTYFELGGNIIDTADMYTNWVEGLTGGEAETIIGKWMAKKKNRDKIFLTTKVRSRMWEGKDGEGLSKNHIIKAIEQSLTRLQTDYIDLYLSHWSDFDTPIEETLTAYEMLIKQGKVRYIGCSNYAKRDLLDALKTGESLGTSYTYIQAYYNLIDRDNFENELLSTITKYKLNTMIYGPLAGGFLTGEYKKGKILPSHARAAFIKDKMTEKNLNVIGMLEKMSKNYDATVAQVALSWILGKGYTPIIGADTANQLEENMKARAVHLTTDDAKKLNDLAL